MKANRKFVQADEAVSPVIAVILMVAITVVLAATVFVLVSDIGNKGAKVAPQSTIHASADNSADDVLVKHVTGESLKANEWKLSITTETGALAYTAACTAALDAGDQIRASKVTTANDACTDTAITSAGADIAAGKYHVVVVHIPSSTTLLDTIVEVL